MLDLNVLESGEYFHPSSAHVLVQHGICRPSLKVQPLAG